MDPSSFCSPLLSEMAKNSEKIGAKSCVSDKTSQKSGKTSLINSYEKHEFHRNCIDPWLLEHRTCPMCKMDILKHYGFIFTGSQESILHVDLEENVNSDAERYRHNVQHTNTMQTLSPTSYQRSTSLQINANSHRISSPDMYPLRYQANQFSRASTPDELSPALPLCSNVELVQPSGSGPKSNFHRVASDSDFSTRTTPVPLRRSVSLDTLDIAVVDPVSTQHAT